MQVTVKKEEGLERELTITVPKATMLERFNAEIEKVRRDLKMPGFRPGNVPVDIVRKKYGAEIQKDVLEDIIAHTTMSAFTERSITPVEQPDINITSFELNQDLVFDVKCEIFPSVPTIDFASINIAKEVAEISDEDTKKFLQEFTKTRTSYEKTEKAAENGDAVLIDFAGKINGVAFDGGTAENYQLILGSKQFIDNFEDQLLGTKAGSEVLVKVRFPDDYGSVELAGKDAEFDVKVNEVQSGKAPEINDEFATQLGFENLAKLEESFKQQLIYQAANSSRTRAKKALFDHLEEVVTFDIPKKLLQMEAESISSQFTKDQVEDVNKIASRRVMLGLLLADIGVKNNISVTDIDIRQAVTAQMQNFPGQEEVIYNYYRKNKDALEQLKGTILEEKVVDFLLSKVTTEEKIISFAEISKIPE